MPDSSHPGGGPPISSTHRRALATLAGAIAALGIGIAIGILLGREADTTDALQAEVEALGARVARLETERDRLREERNLLEARLAAEQPAAVCPDEFVATGDLVPYFTVEHRCGWHVLYDPTFPAAVEDRPGLRAEAVVFSRLAISLAPRDGPIGDYELIDWSADPGEDDARLPPLSAWVAEERDRFEDLQRDDRFEGGDGVTVHRLVGTQVIFDEPVEVHVLLWRYDDALSGARHVVRAFALSPSARVVEALDRLARSFRVRDAG